MLRYHTSGLIRLDLAAIVDRHDAAPLTGDGVVRISSHRIPTRRRRIVAAVIHYLVRIPHLVWQTLTLGFLRRRRFPEEVGEVLIIRADGLGDVVMTLPAISAVRDLWPGARITLLGGSPARVLLPHLRAVDGAMFLDLPWAQRSVRRINWSELRRILRDIRRRGFDLIIDLRGDFRNIFLMQAMGSGFKIGYGWSGCGFLLDREIPWEEGRHEVEHQRDVARVFGAWPGRAETKDNSNETARFDLAVADEDWDAVRGRFPALEAAPDGFVIVHPGAQWPGRQWTVAGYAGVSDRIAGELGLPVVVTGVRRERDFCNAVLARMEKTPIDLVDRVTFSEFLAVLSRARLFLGVDSGPMHLAVALGVPTVALFGPGDPAAIGPYGPRSIVVSEAGGFACSPCAQDDCPFEGRSCMDAIGVEHVWQVVLKQLSGRSS